MPWEKRLFTLGKPHVRLKTTLQMVLPGNHQSNDNSWMVFWETSSPTTSSVVARQDILRAAWRWGEGGEQSKLKFLKAVFLLPFLSNAPQIAASLWLISRALMKLILTIFTRVLIPFNGIFWGPCSAIFSDIIFPVFTGMFAWSYLFGILSSVTLFVCIKFGSQSFHPCYLIFLKSRADFIFTSVKGPC